METPNPCLPPRLAARFTLSLLLACFALPAFVFAQSVWLVSPTNPSFNDPANYAPSPNFAANPALSFGSSSVVDPEVTAAVTLGSLTFSAGSPSYIFGGTSTISITNATNNAVVLVNNSTAPQTFNNPMAVIGTANGRWNAAAGDIVLAGGLIVNIASRNAFIGSSTGSTFTISGPVTGVAGIVKGANGLAANQGALVLSNENNTFQGPLTANAGSIILTSTGAEGAAAGVINLGNTAGGDSAAVLIGASGVTSSRTITVQSGSTGTMRLGGSSAFTSGTSAFNGNVTLGSGVGKGVTFDVPGAAEITFGGAIQDIAGLSANFPAVTKVGTGTAILDGGSTFQGDLIVNAGTVRLGASERLRDNVTVRLSGGNLATTGYSETLGTLHLTADAALDLGVGVSIVTLGSLTRAAGTLTITNWSGSPGGGGVDRLIVSQSPTTEMLGAIQFAGHSGAVIALSVGNGFEIVPDTGLATPPVITSQPRSVTQPVGSTVSLSVTASGSGTLSYQWRRGDADLSDGGGVAGARSSTLTISDATTVASGAYTVVVTNSVDSVISDVTDIVIYGAPTITAQPQSLTRDLGQSATFSVAVSSAVNVTYQWSKGGSPIPGANQSSHTISVVTEESAGDFDVVVTNPAGSTTSATATLTISSNPVAPTILSQPASVTAEPGSTATFSVQAVGTAPLSYQWRRNGSDLTDRTTATLTLTNVAPGDAGSYAVVVTNPHGSATSSAANLLVLAGETPISAWRQMHPGGGGQVQGLSFDPNFPGRMYECSDVEGVYRSDDWGLTWLPIGEELIHHMAFHVAVTPGDSNTIYCGTLYGIHKSTDAGRTWNLVLGGYSNASWAFDPFDPTGRTWIAGRSWYIKSSQLPSQTAQPSQQTSGAFFVVRSTDAGETITQHSYQAGTGTNQVYTITYDPTRQGHVYIAGDAGLFRSRDGGAAWEQILLPAGATLTRGADVTPDGKWLYATVGTAGTLYVAKIDTESTAFAWSNVHTDTTLLANAGGNYWRPLVDPRSTVPVEGGGLGVGQHRVIIGSFTSTASTSVGLVEGEFADTGPAVGVNSWGYAFRRAGTAPGWDFEFGWNEINPQCRQYAWMPRSWDNGPLPAHIAPVDATPRRSRILMASQQSVYFGGPDDPDSWTLLSSSYVGTMNGASFYRTRGFSSTVNFTMDGWKTYYAQGMADNRVLESFDSGYSWTQDTVPGGARVGNGDAIHILRPRSPGETPVVLLATAPGAGGGADTAVGTLFRKSLTNMAGPTDPWVNLGSMPNSARIWYIESLPADNDTVFVGTQGGLFWTDNARDPLPTFRSVGNITDSFKQGRIFVDPRSTANDTVLYLKTSGSSRLYIAHGTRASVAEPYTFTYAAITANGNVRALDDLYYWRRSSDQREFMAHTNGSEEVWMRERALDDPTWSGWARVANRAGILAVKNLPWVDWTGRGVDLASQTIVPNLSSAPDGFTISGLGGFENDLVGAAWVEDGKHGYAMFKLSRRGLGDWQMTDWTGSAIPGSFDGLMGVARVWQSKVVQTDEDLVEYLTASRGGGLWARAVNSAGSPPVISSATSAEGIIGQPFFYQIEADSAPNQYACSGLPGGLSLDESTGVISGTPIQAGEFSIALLARNAGGSSEPVSLSLRINRGGQTIIFDAVADKTFGDPPFALPATSSSALSVGFEVTSGPATVVGNMLTLTGAGSVTVTATQSGDDNYLPAVPVIRTFFVNPSPAAVSLGSLGRVYDGYPKPVEATTSPVGLALTVTYNGSTEPPVTAGSYLVEASVADPNYVGSGTGMLVIAKAQASVTVYDLVQIYTGTILAPAVATDPAGIATVLEYSQGVTPVSAGSYPVTATIVDPNYSGTAQATFVIRKAGASIALAGLDQLYNGAPRSVTAVTDPIGLSVDITYDGGTTAPTYPGSYAVVATINDADHEGAVSDEFEITTTVLVRHGAVVTGGIDGSMQVLLPETTTLSGMGWISGDLMVPGTPTVTLNGSPTFGGILDADGDPSPSSYTILLNGNPVLRHLVRRVDPIAMPVVSLPPAPAGTRSVVLNQAGQSLGDVATLRNLTLTGNPGRVVLPPGTYGNIAATGNGVLVLGTVGSPIPEVYNLQLLSLNALPGFARVEVVGPVLVTVAKSVVANGVVGNLEHPEWLILRVSSGGLASNGTARIYGSVVAPNGTITLSGSVSLSGSVAADRLTVNGASVVNDAMP